MKKIPFHKIQGNGNDFILIDNRRGVLKGKNLRGLAKQVCHRNRSVGADGLIVIVPSTMADFKWRFFNSDGSEAAMCGNGSRCAARFAVLRKIAPKKMTFETLAGIIHAEVKKDTVRVQLTGAGDLQLNIAIPVAGGTRTGHFINTGVPHLVKDDPVFDGLPVNCMMGAVYENVWAENTLVGVGGETIAAAIGYDWFPNYELSKRHYYGPGNTWWGADMASVPVAKGRCIVSQLRIIENLGKDPVADKIVFNVTEWMHTH